MGMDTCVINTLRRLTSEQKDTHAIRINRARKIKTPVVPVGP